MTGVTGKSNFDLCQRGKNVKSRIFKISVGTAPYIMSYLLPQLIFFFLVPSDGSICYESVVMG